MKTGTQLIDGFWRVLRQELRNNSKTTTAMVKVVVRMAQWKYWNQGHDLCLERNVDGHNRDAPLRPRHPDGVDPATEQLEADLLVQLKIWEHGQPGAKRPDHS